MKEGMISPDEADALPIEKMLLEPLLEKPKQPGEIRPSRLTPVASTITNPTPLTANWPKCIKCQSVALPSSALY